IATMGFLATMSRPTIRNIVIGFPPFGKLRVGIQKKLIHPTAGAAAILLVFVIGRTEIAILVKIIFGVLVMFFHVDLEFFSGTAAVPAMIAIREAIRHFCSREQ